MLSMNHYQWLFLSRLSLNKFLKKPYKQLKIFITHFIITQRYYIIILYDIKKKITTNICMF